MISRRQFLRGDFSSRVAAAGGGGRPVIGASCLANRDTVCRSCAEACELSAIRFVPRVGGAALPEVDGDRCTGCGMCAAPCPVGALALA